MEAIVVKKKLLSLKEMEPLAKEATRSALSSYPEPPKEEQDQWALGQFETDEEGIFEIYIPHERSQDAKVISCARVNRRTGEVSVEVFLEK